jgi:hypothetical protein
MSRAACRLAVRKTGVAMTRQQDPLTAFLAVLASMAETTRRTRRQPRGPVRRRARPGRSGKTNAARSKRPAAAVFRGFGDDAWVYPRRPSDYVAAGMVVGSTGAFALVALGRAARARPDGGPDSSLARMRAAAIRAVRQRSRSVRADDRGDGHDSVPAVAVPGSASVPGPAVGTEAVGRAPRHTSGAV